MKSDNSDPYQAPESEILDSAKPAGLRNSIVAGLASLVTLPMLIVAIDGNLDSISWTRATPELLLVSVLTGAGFYPLQRLRWYWVLVLSPVCALVLSVAIAAIMEQFGLL